MVGRPGTPASRRLATGRKGRTSIACSCSDEPLDERRKKAVIILCDMLVSARLNVSVLSIGHLAKHCSACASPSQTNGNGLRRCAGCKMVHYCSSVRYYTWLPSLLTKLSLGLQECQTRDWSMHKSECTALQSWAKAAPSLGVAIPSDAVRCLGRILWTKKKSGGRSTFVCFVPVRSIRELTRFQSKEIDAMQSRKKWNGR